MVRLAYMPVQEADDEGGEGEDDDNDEDDDDDDDEDEEEDEGKAEEPCKTPQKKKVYMLDSRRIGVCCSAAVPQSQPEECYGS